MHVLRSRRLILFAILAVSLVAAGTALSGVLSQQVIADTGNVHIRIVRTNANDFDTGWHVHPGVAIVQVQEGSFKIYQGSCTPTTVGAGQTFIEAPHLPVRGIAAGPVRWTTTLITTGNDPPQIALSAYTTDKNYNPCPSVP
ncbi:MAG TPA: AraC family ligand binding domain-containing protein [Gaiellaceae bacterium]|nr:AraC family ligand binding domain-containing protein [Gaiellaceae bacterium]